jgi:hypothetical protein
MFPIGMHVEVRSIFMPGSKSPYIMGLKYQCSAELVVVVFLFADWPL